ncbi:CPBP family intramembrane glutamic endopeptidase [Bacillus sp. DTU_2020_1000418_1_SI_GHA_SEK_038]|uniref:CPBP family intramembrane glutamic endopeptidase n=1 Tax=Bacillus sp. DTU_2020_1000418_1_SI_GHA_SEK_038 TaxID=3077585 RepID=UPI0028E67A3A|nr:CPBP family intramembrane glutamic endopeptidase [Bacillus sp. DTU_2020_1000418_1_SI_GHA_SEK_038]WNS75953.1 CPBP family intramembrane glutamic endopeptidase [Bacillus sp. DTU_2020_1000418_1_SI_GHA_SEK_038]
MRKEYWYILIAYIGMQLSSLIGVPFIAFWGTLYGKSMADMETIAVTSWIVISFTITLIITLALLRKEMKESLSLRNATSAGSSIAWAIGGVFLALFAQSIAANIENLIGIEMGSENTQQIIRLIQASPLVVVVSSIIGPILEEIIFRKIIFGTLYQRLNFFLSALISSVIFALAHFEFEHILLYSAMGFTFAFLYVKTKQILVPIFAHVAMNTLVVIIQFNRENIENWIKEAEKMQSFIGGFL